MNSLEKQTGKENCGNHGNQTSWDHKAKGQSRNTQHQVHPWQIFSTFCNFKKRDIEY